MNLREIDDISLEKVLNSQTDNSNLILHKTNIMLLNNGWNDKNERLIISIGENAASYKWMHERSSTYYKNTSSIFNITLIILAVFLSAETIIPPSYIEDNKAIFISKQILIYIITILTILQNFFKYDQLVEKHINASLQFNELYHDIQKQMCMYRKDRINATIYLSENLKRYDTLVINNPDILKSIIQVFKNTFKDTNLALPDIADKIQKIEIITENNDQNIKNLKTENVNFTKTEELSSSSSTELCNNLSNIYNIFQIHGDISDNDIQNFKQNELNNIKKNVSENKTDYEVVSKNKTDYEYKRFLQHSKESD
jgi:hypothetical protein